MKSKNFKIGDIVYFNGRDLFDIGVIKEEKSGLFLVEWYLDRDDKSLYSLASMDFWLIGNIDETI